MIKHNVWERSEGYFCIKKKKKETQMDKGKGKKKTKKKKKEKTKNHLGSESHSE